MPTAHVSSRTSGATAPRRRSRAPTRPPTSGYIDTLRRVVVGRGRDRDHGRLLGQRDPDLDRRGTPVREIELVTPPAPGFAQAFGVATAPNGDVYVMDRLNQRLERFNPAGVFLAQGGSRGTQPGKFSWPEAVAVAPDGSVWAADTRDDRIQRWPAP